MIDNRLKATKRKPWMKWYPADWRGEQLLRLVSREARSVWVDLLGLMHESTLIGTLFVNGKIPTIETLAKMFGDDPERLAGWIRELVDNGVCSVDEDGALYSRKMRNAAEISEKGRKDVQKRGGSWAPGKKQKAPKKGVNGVANGDPNRGAIRDPIAQRLDNTTELEELESPLTSSHPEPLYLADSLLVSQKSETRPPAVSVPVVSEFEQLLRPASKPISSKRGTRWPAGQTVPDDWIAAAAKRRAERGLPVIDLALEAEKFTNYWTAKSGQAATKVDWAATWRMWSLNAYGANANGRDTRAGQPGNVKSGFLTAIERELAEIEAAERASRH